MKKIKFTALFLSMAMVISLGLGGCNSSNTVKGTAIGAGSGAALGAIVGGIFGKGKGAAIGAAVGTAVGAGTGAIIGNKMDKKAAEAAAIEGANVEKVVDVNGLDAVKVTFDSGILFGLNSSTLSENSKSALRQFANVLKSDATLDIDVIGHTDKTGTYEVNQRVSTQRAQSVRNYLQSCGVGINQFKHVEGVAYDQYDESLSAAQNRRVEVFLYASEQMIKDAQAASN
ncbi:OmpA family protein [Bacteroides sp. 214]|uniref:OmpA family protein n=1 Tax=Bacteroides sp. 214 TaxID=2302935 RepID=UPI0013D18BC2|nr:OmpA family protein [Bacteroides sp. 214]NDW13587.1 OmpA family protein [Bacteroides sp. 214]